MPEAFVTLFDRNYVHHGFALYRSLVRHFNGAFCLHVICMDDHAFQAIGQLGLENFIPIALADIETEELKTAKASRTRGEYCWTLTPFTFDFVFNRDTQIKQVTYLDSDLWLRDSCGEIFTEFSDSTKQVLITKHAYHPDYDQTETSGKFCVQFLTFKRHGSIAVRRRWQQQCLDWCYSRTEEGKFGDQKYLDEWPRLFPELVHVLKAESLVMGPWNAKRFPYSDAAAWHFHGVRVRLDASGAPVAAMSDFYEIPQPTKNYVYNPYVAEILGCYHFFQANFPGIYGN